MRTFFAAAFIVFASFGVAIAQQPYPSVISSGEAPNMGVAPKTINGVGRADVRVFDESGNPIQNARVKMESNRSDGYFCETDWGLTNAHGIMVLPPLHMGEVTIKVKANGFRPQTLHIENSSLGEPIRVTLVKR